MRFSKVWLMPALTAMFLVSTASAALYPGFWEFRTDKDRSKAMDLKYSRIGDGGQLHIWSANGSDAQLFALSRNGAYWTIRNANSKKAIRCPFDVSNSVQVFQMGMGQTSESMFARYYRWKINEVCGLDTVCFVLDTVELKKFDGADTVYAPQSVNKGVHILGGGTTDGTACVIYDNNGSLNQKWQAIDRNVAWVYADVNYGGTKIGLAPGDYTMADLQAMGIGNDWISSHQAAGGFTITIFMDDDFSGTSWTGGSCAAYSSGWNDKVSSIKVYANASGATTANGASFALWSNEEFAASWNTGIWQAAGATPATGTPLGAVTAYDPAGLVVEGGMLKIKTWFDETSGSYKTGKLEMVNSDLQYGVIEARLKTSSADGGYVTSLGAYRSGAADRYEELLITLEGKDRGSFSADLLESKNTPADNEARFNTCQYCFGANKVRGTLVNGVAPDFDDPYWTHDGRWHVYRIEMTAAGVTWLVDGVPVKQIDASTHYFDPEGNDLASDPSGCAASNGYFNGFIPGYGKRAFIESWLPTDEAAAGTGGEWTDSQLPSYVLVDYLRVYK
jgi:hypothetical protein